MTNLNKVKVANYRKVHPCFKTIQKKPHSSVNVNTTSLWLIHLCHCKANQVGSLSVAPVAIDWPGGIGDAWSLRIVDICIIIVWSAKNKSSNSKVQ